MKTFITIIKWLLCLSDTPPQNCNCMQLTEEEVLNKPISDDDKRVVRHARINDSTITVSFFDVKNRKTYGIEMPYCGYCGKKINNKIQKIKSGSNKTIIKLKFKSHEKKCSRS